MVDGMKDLEDEDEDGSLDSLSQVLSYEVTIICYFQLFAAKNIYSFCSKVFLNCQL
jgi:hypothetical protein